MVPGAKHPRLTSDLCALLPTHTLTPKPTYINMHAHAHIALAESNPVHLFSFLTPTWVPSPRQDSLALENVSLASAHRGWYMLERIVSVRVPGPTDTLSPGY